ncbi:hypothetical protein F4804DRAFT_94058 [Jackrogersella minutella]|nr:hypothetical protein F4804DRAFT_94058 [Jackrogersella minutella]
MANVNSKSKRLPELAANELAAVSEWLQSDKADFQTVNQINICGNPEGLAVATADLLKQFAAEVKLLRLSDLVSTVISRNMAVYKFLRTV